jgi:hypothetical protein
MATSGVRRSGWSPRKSTQRRRVPRYPGSMTPTELARRSPFLAAEDRRSRREPLEPRRTATRTPVSIMNPRAPGGMVYSLEGLRSSPHSVVRCIDSPEAVGISRASCGRSLQRRGEKRRSASAAIEGRMMLQLSLCVTRNNIISAEAKDP